MSKNLDFIRSTMTDHWIPEEVIEQLATLAERFPDQPNQDRAFDWAYGGGIILHYRPWLKAAILHDEYPWEWFDEAIANNHVSSDDMEAVAQAAYEDWFWHQYRHIMSYE